VVDDFDGVPVYGTEDTVHEVVDLGEVGGDPTPDDPWEEREQGMRDDSLVTADELSASEQQDPPRELRVHPLVTALIESRGGGRMVALEDFNEERPRTESLPVKLNKDELIALGKQASDKAEYLDHVKEQNANQRKAMKQGEEALESELREVHRHIGRGEDNRHVPVQRIADLPRNVSLLIRLDNGEVVAGRERALTAREIEEATQVRLPGVS
jgi:hypothetical protein